MASAKNSGTDSTSAADVAAEKASEVATTAQDKAGEVASSAQGKATDVASEAKDHAQQLLAESRQSVRSQVETQGEQLATTAKSLANEMKSMATAGEGPLGGLMEQGADRLSQIADRFDQGGLDAISGDARRFARSRPVVFLASTFAAGFAAGRLVKHADNDELKEAVKPEGDQTNEAVNSRVRVASLPATPVTS